MTVWSRLESIRRNRSSFRRNRYGRISFAASQHEGKNGQKAANGKGKSRAVQIGDFISDWTSKLFAHPYMQVGVILFCIAWFLGLGLQADLLTAALSILAITLTQMVLNSQYDREAEAHRRDIAMHAKLDELIFRLRKARNEFVGVRKRGGRDRSAQGGVKEAIQIGGRRRP